MMSADIGLGCNDSALPLFENFVISKNIRFLNSKQMQMQMQIQNNENSLEP